LIVFGDYNGGTPAWYSVACFAAGVLGVGFLFAWMRLRSGSLWPCVMLHAVHNTFVQEVLTPLTADTGHTAWFIDEFGAVLPLCIIAASIFIVRLWPVDSWRLRHLGTE
jgi:membrane protease YdiL (CAAX protease family)